MNPLTLLSNWKLIVSGVLIASIGTFVVYKYNSFQNELKRTKADLEQSEANNVTLRTNIETLKQTNDDNKRVIDQLTLNAKLNSESIKKLSSDINATNKSFDKLSSKIDAIKDEPTGLTSYLKEAIEGIQNQEATGESK